MGLKEEQEQRLGMILGHWPCLGSRANCKCYDEDKKTKKPKMIVITRLLI